MRDSLMMVDLRKDSDQVRDAWRSSNEPHVPLSLAAALAFHEAHQPAPAFIAELDYDDALNMTAAALSCVVDIYAIHPRSGQPVPVKLNLKAGRFTDGGSAYRGRSGRNVRSLVVRREQIPTAMSLVCAAGISFQFLGTDALLR